MLPYVAKDFDHLRRMFESDFGQGVRDEMLQKFNWRALDTWYNGTRETTSNRPLNSIEDFKGLKLRVPNAKQNLNYAKLSGASPTRCHSLKLFSAADQCRRWARKPATNN